MHEILSNKCRNVKHVIGIGIDVLDWNNALSKLTAWASSQESRYVCICNAHSLVIARRDRSFEDVISKADMATPDGAPVAWVMRRLGVYKQERINGPDFMWRYCQEAANREESIYLYGSSPDTLAALERKLLSIFPKLKIAGSHSPPFRQLTAEEDESIIKNINDSFPGTVWVSLGCPKQERWMAEHRGQINAPMIGVGAAFDYHAGTIKRAPLWMQNNGLEWLYRLCCEPRRLWKRYLVTNTYFTYYAAKQLLKRN